MTIYMSNISYKATKEDISELLEEFGGILNITIPKDHAKNRMRGYAFIVLNDPSQENKVIDNLHNMQHMGRTIRVESANSEKSPYFG